MILSFPYLVVILTTLGTPKNIFCVNNNIMNDNSKQNKTTRARTSLVVLYLRNYAAGIHGHNHESSDHFEYPKKSILKSSHPKRYLPKLHTQKNPGIENFKPKKILRSSPSLEVRSTPPWDNRQSWTSVYYFRDTTPWLCFIVITINLLKRWVCGKGMQHSFPNSKIIIQKSVNVIQSTLGLWTPCYCELEPKSRLTSQIRH